MFFFYNDFLQKLYLVFEFIFVLLKYSYIVLFSCKVDQEIKFLFQKFVCNKKLDILLLNE